MNGDHGFSARCGILSQAAEFANVVKLLFSVKYCEIWYWPVITFISQLKSKFAKHSHKTANLLQLTNYSSSQQISSAATRKHLHSG